MDSDKHYTLQLLNNKVKIETVDFNRIDFKKIPIFVLSKVSKKIVGIFFVSLQNLNSEISTFFQTIEDENCLGLSLDSKSKAGFSTFNEDTVQNTLILMNENHGEGFDQDTFNLMNENVVDVLNEDNLNEHNNIQDYDLDPGLIKKDAVFDKVICIKEHASNDTLYFSKYKSSTRPIHSIPKFFTDSINILLDEHIEIKRIQGTATSSITLEAFESNEYSSQKHLSELSQQIHTEPDIVGDFYEEKNFILNNMLAELNPERKGELFLEFLIKAQNEELDIYQETSFSSITINYRTP
ncbi:hypothetical protein CDIK_0976 [Cucumispora dikerogammari]|nr:hypothetical protein CDIK_0976 [Cucumispora dikerogammari]